MEKIKLKISKREEKTPNQLRREGLIPATLYGANVASESVQLCAKDFSRLPAGVTSHMLELDYEEKATNAIIRKVQRKSTKDFVYNIEFYKVDMQRKVSMSVPLRFGGISAAVQAGGKLEENYQNIQIEVLPDAIPDAVEVDLGMLDGNKTSIHFADLKLADGIKCLNPLDEIVIKVKAAKAVKETPGK